MENREIIEALESVLAKIKAGTVHVHHWSIGSTNSHEGWGIFTSVEVRVSEKGGEEKELRLDRGE